ncbi:hypothetical protein GJ496_006939 [Pomphorhynchus laevis]|nr:hypothetical protein GJ496_006939 [Pomphorhynchus laevis]
MNATNTQETPLKSLTRKIRQDIGSMLDSFVDIILAVKPVDTSILSSATVLPDRHIRSLTATVKAANTAKSAESILNGINEMKHLVITGNLSAIYKHMIDERNTEMKDIHEIEFILEKIRDEAALLLSSLEYQYYSAPLHLRGESDTNI